MLQLVKKGVKLLPFATAPTAVSLIRCRLKDCVASCRSWGNSRPNCCFRACKYSTSITAHATCTTESVQYCTPAILPKLVGRSRAAMRLLFPSLSTKLHPKTRPGSTYPVETKAGPTVDRPPHQLPCPLPLFFSDEHAGTIICGTNVTCRQCKSLLLSALHHIWCVFKMYHPSARDDDCCIAITSLQDANLAIHASYGSVTPLDAEIIAALASSNEFICVDHIQRHPTRAKGDAANPSRMSFFVGLPVGRVHVSLLKRKALKSTKKNETHFVLEFKRACGQLHAQLKDAARYTDIDNTLELQASRFVRHEVKNSLIGALADLDALQLFLVKRLDDIKDSEQGTANLRRDLDSAAGVCSDDSTSMRRKLLQERQPESPTCGCNIIEPSLIKYDDSLIIAKSAHVEGATMPESVDLRYGHSTHHVRDRLLAQDLNEVLSSVVAISRELESTMDTVMCSGMVSDIITGTYKPRTEEVDIGNIVSALCTKNRILINPSTFVVESDSQLLRHVLVNAISNATKYGAQNEPIAVHVRSEWLPSDSIREEKSQEEASPISDAGSPVRNLIVIDVVNKPGPNHDRLVALDSTSRIFEPGVRLHGVEDSPPKNSHGTNVSGIDTAKVEEQPSLSPGIHRVSNGDGAWIMQRCAAALGGRCEIAFHAEETKFTFTFCAYVPRGRRASSIAKKSSEAEAPFILPQNVELIALDDSASQRRLLCRFFRNTGVEPDAIKVYGENSDVVDTFVPDVVERVRRAGPHTRFAIFLDQHLNYTCFDGSSVVASGIDDIGRQLRQQLEVADLDSQVLMLARTADDNLEVIHSLCEVVHDHFPKRAMCVSYSVLSVT